MTPLFGRPDLSRPGAAVRAGILVVAMLLASTPLSLLFAPPAWAVIPLITVITVCGAGAIARALLRHRALVPLAQVAVVALLVSVVEVATGAIQLGPGPLGLGPLLTEQPAVLQAGAVEIGSGRAPIHLEAPGIVLVTLVSALLVLALDLLFIDLGWHTPTGFILLGLMLVPALMYPAGGPWFTAIGPLAGGMLIFATRTLHSDTAFVQGDERPHTGPVHRRGRLTTATVGAVVAVLALTPALSAVLPQSEEPAFRVDLDTINAWRGREAPALGSPMIDDSISVRRDLLRRGETEMLQYTTDESSPGYLRLRTLTSFDGENFFAADGGSAGDSDENSDEQDQMPEAFSDRQQAEAPVDGLPRYDFTITDMAGDRLPAPSNIRWFDSTIDEDLSSGDPTAGELAIPGGNRNLSGVEYSVQAETNDVDPEELRAVDPAQFEVPYETDYLSQDVPAVTADLADQVVADSGAETAYDTAVAFEEHFRANYDYSLTVQSAPGEDPIEAFLEEQIGYCEQFAAAYALMMNSQGYPTRVAIGFTAGSPEGDSYSVTNHNAHAWPEVWFGPEHGWVRFEPTPPQAGTGILTPPHMQQDAEGAEPAEPAEEAQNPAEEEAQDPAGEETAPEEETEETTPADEPGADTQDQGGLFGADGEAATDGTALRRGLIGVGAAVAMAAAGAMLAAVLRRRWAAARDARWAALLAGGGPAGSGASADGSALGPPASSAAERIRRDAGQLAWSELHSGLRSRDRAISWLGWTGRWGRPPLQLTLDPARPPREALDDVLDQAGAGNTELTDEHRAAAARIGGAVSAARYAPAVAAAAGGDGTTGSGRSASDVPAGTSAQPADEPRQVHHPLRDDADLLLHLIRTAR